MLPILTPRPVWPALASPTSSSIKNRPRFDAHDRGSVNGRIRLERLRPRLRGWTTCAPAFAFGFGDAGGQVVADFGNTWALSGIRPVHAATYATVLVTHGVPTARPQIPVETLKRG